MHHLWITGFAAGNKSKICLILFWNMNNNSIQYYLDPIDVDTVVSNQVIKILLCQNCWQDEVTANIDLGFMRTHLTFIKVTLLLFLAGFTCFLKRIKSIQAKISLGDIKMLLNFC